MSENKDKIKELNPEDKRTFSEKFIMLVRKKWLTNSVSTIIIVVILVALFLLINLGAQKLELPDIDVTKNQIYTLSDDSKELIKKIDETVTVYIYGFNNQSTDYSLNQENVIKFVKQYNKANEQIKYEVLTKESNPAKMEEYELQGSYDCIIVESGDKHKLVSSSDLVTYDYVTSQKVYLLEETLTNSIFSVVDDYSPKAYFVTGHGELPTSAVATAQAYMQNESILSDSINLMTTTIPDDCSLLLILAPSSDYLESEVEQIRNYINKGGNILFGAVTSTTAISSFPNLQSILDIYGATLENSGYVFENDANKIVSGAPYIITPELSTSSNITKDIATNGAVFMPYTGRVTFVSDDELADMMVEKISLAWSSVSSVFVTDLKNDVYSAAAGLQQEKSDVVALAVKTIQKAEDDKEEILSKAIFFGDTIFTSDYVVEGVSSYYPMSYIKNNKDLFINSVAFLAEKESVIHIRKDMSTSTYAPTATENMVVFIIVFAVPIVILVAGIVVGIFRKRRK